MMPEHELWFITYPYSVNVFTLNLQIADTSNWSVQKYSQNSTGFFKCYRKACDVLQYYGNRILDPVDSKYTATTGS